jgi:dTDP-4-amino-4,6-dideoxygalactose transaminase
LKVPFGDLKIHYQAYRSILDGAIQRVLDSGHFILGPELQRFERELAQFVGVEHAVGCASGTEAIYLALAACDVTTGDEVVVVAHTAVPTISAISMTGATPVFVDIDRTNYLMDTSQLESKITGRTKAIIPVHLYGQMVDMEAVLKIAAKHDLRVIEDVAQAIGATYRGATAGALGDMGAFSFYPSKNLGAFGDAGAVTTKSKSLYDRLVMLRNYGQSQRYHHDVIGINSRLDEIQAAILSAQLPFVPEWNARRIEIAARYTKGLQEVVDTPPAETRSEHVYHLYVIQIDERDQLQAHLTERGIHTLIHYPIPAHLQKAYAYMGYRKGDLPASEYIAGRILSLPMFPELTDDQIDYVIGAIREFQKNRQARGVDQTVGDEGAFAASSVTGLEGLVSQSGTT